MGVRGGLSVHLSNHKMNGECPTKQACAKCGGYISKQNSGCFSHRAYSIAGRAELMKQL